MRAIEPWVGQPLNRFVEESAARVVLLMTSSGQVIAQHGFTRSLDVMSAAALGAGIVASTGELGALLGGENFGALVHQGQDQGVYLAPFTLSAGPWIGLVVYGAETSLGLVQFFFGQLVSELVEATPTTARPKAVLADDFEDELDASLRALFGE